MLQRVQPTTSVTSHGRFVVALAVGLLSAVQVWLITVNTGGAHRDITQLWLAAQLLREGGDVYAIETPMRAFYGYAEYTFPYPITAAVVLLPVARLPVEVAAALVVGLGFAAFTYAATADGIGGLWFLLSRSYNRVVALAQVTPLVLAGAAWPPLGVLAAVKPTVGLALFAYRPSWWIVGGGLALGAVGLAFDLDWPLAWLRTATALPYYAPPIAVWVAGGPLLLLAALRWRRPEARLLAVLACMPTTFVGYDQLALFLVARRWWEAALLAAASWAAIILGSAQVPAGVGEPSSQLYYRAPMVAMMYLPSLIMVLRRPNEGPLPTWLERTIAWAPRWLRGNAGPAAAV